MKSRGVCLCLCVCVVMSLSVEGGVPCQGSELFRCQVHRGGGRNTRPDNCLDTFKWCWEHGVAPEADARMTKDGIAIALHDDTLNRVGRGILPSLANAKISTLTWNEIKDVDVGSYLSPEYSYERVPTMDSVFKEMAKSPNRYLYVDEKGAAPAVIASLARKHGVEKRVYYTSPRFQLMSRWQRCVPGGLGMVWLGTWPKDNSAEAVAKADKFLFDSFSKMDAANWSGVSQVQIHVRTDLKQQDPFCPSSACIERAIAYLHSKGITVQCLTWTCGANKDVLRRLWGFGFDNFATDDPLVLFDLLPEFAKTETK